MAIFSASVGITDIFDGADAYTPYLTNEAEVVPADNAGSVAASTTVTGNFKVLLGNYDITSSSVFSVVSASGISLSNVSINTSGLYTVDVAGTALSLSSSIVLRAAHNGTSFDLNLSITRSDAAVNGSSASGIRLTSDRQTFSFSNSASGTVSSDGNITLTVDRQNMSGTTVWTVVNNKGSVPTLGVTAVNGTDTATVTATAFGDNGGSGANDQVLFVKITSTAGGLSDTVTIHKIRQGDNVSVSKVGTTASVVSSNGDTVTLDDGTDGVNGDSFKQFTVYKAATTSGNAGTPSSTGVVIANDGSMTTPPTGWSQSRPTATVYETIYASDATFKRTASTGSYALEQTWTAASAVSGVGGARGSRSFFIEVATLNAASSQGSALATSKSTSNPWQSSSAISATATQGLRVADWVKNYSDGQDGTIVALDTVTIYNVTNQWSATRFYTGSVWASVEEVIDGNLLVQGTIAAQKLVLNSGIMEISGNELSIVGAALNRTHRLSVGTHTIAVPYGAQVMTLTGCGAGGSRPATSATSGQTTFVTGSAGGAGCWDYPLAIPSGSTHLQIVVGAALSSGNGEATTVSNSTDSGSSYTNILTLGGGLGGAAFVSNSGINNGTYTSTGGSTVPSIEGYSGRGAPGGSVSYSNGTVSAVYTSGEDWLNGGLAGTLGTRTDWPYGTAGSYLNPQVGTNVVSGGSPKGFGCGAHGWTNGGGTQSTLAVLGTSGFLKVDFGT